MKRGVWKPQTIYESRVQRVAEDHLSKVLKYIAVYLILGFTNCFGCLLISNPLLPFTILMEVLNEICSEMKKYEHYEKLLN